MPATNHVMWHDLQLSLIINWICCCVGELNSQWANDSAIWSQKLSVAATQGQRNMPLVCIVIGPVISLWDHEIWHFWINQLTIYLGLLLWPYKHGVLRSGKWKLCWSKSHNDVCFYRCILQIVLIHLKNYMKKLCTYYNLLSHSRQFLYHGTSFTAVFALTSASCAYTLVLMSYKSEP